MATTAFDPHHPHGFTLADPVLVAQKLQRFALAGPEQVYFLFDFDRTLTTSKHTGDNTTTWQILHGLLSKEGQKMSDAIRGKYLAIEENSGLTQEESHTFSTTLLNLHATHGTNRRDMELAAKQIRLRDGTTALFTACETAHLPTVILSAGIRDIIELITQEHHIHPTMLVSIKLQFATDGRITGWDKDSLVLTNTKHESVKQWVSHIAAARPYTVLVGDTIEDARMVEGDDTVLRIRVSDTAGEHAHDPAYYQKSFDAGYDLIVEEDLAPLVPLTQWIADSRM